MSTKLSSEDFLVGLFATLARRNWGTLSIGDSRFDRASAEAYKQLAKLANERGVELRFVVTPHPVYGDSTVLRDAMARVGQWDLISFDNPQYRTVRFKMTPARAARIMERFGLDQELFDVVTDRFESAYQGGSGATVA